MGLDQRERERERGVAAHEIARLAEGTLVSRGGSHKAPQKN